MRGKKIVMKAVCLLSLLLIFGCLEKLGIKDNGQADSSVPGKIVYLENNIHVQERYNRSGEPVYRASYANYINPPDGHLIIPANTKVKIEKAFGIKGRRIVIIDQTDGKKIDFEFNARNMKMTMDEYIDLISSPAEVSLGGLSGTDIKGIKEGKAYIGMTKKGIRIALGYPAAHKTPSLEENTWVYWQNRFKTMAIEFGANGTVQNIKK